MPVKGVATPGDNSFLSPFSRFPFHRGLVPLTNSEPPRSGSLQGFASRAYIRLTKSDGTSCSRGNCNSQVGVLRGAEAAASGLAGRRYSDACIYLANILFSIAAFAQCGETEGLAVRCL